MQKVNIDKNFYKGYVIDFDYGTNANLFHNDKYMVKEYLKGKVTPDIEKIVTKASELDNPHVVKPEFGLYSKGKFVGYGMEYIKNASYINSFITNNIKYPILSFNQRKQLMLDLARTVRYLYENNFAYYDLHENNILYAEDGLKLIDIDGSILKGTVNAGMDFNAAIRKTTKNLSLFTLAFIYNNDPETFRYLVTERDQILDMLPSRLEEFFTYAIDDNYKVYPYVEDRINELSIDVFNKTGSVLKRKL